MKWFVVVALTAACSSSQPVTAVASPVTAPPSTAKSIPLPGDAVGVAATAAGVFVSDQESNTIYAIDHGALEPFATGLLGVDLLTALPDGSLVTGGKTGAVVRIAPDGTQSQIAAGFEEVRGTAYDPAGHRLFVVEHGKANHTLHVLPL